MSRFAFLSAVLCLLASSAIASPVADEATIEKRVTHDGQVRALSFCSEDLDMLTDDARLLTTRSDSVPAVTPIPTVSPWWPSPTLSTAAVETATR